MKRIGIYVGTFDPVHAGHIAFALQALQSARLDRIYFVPERQPRHKHGVEHFGHRVAMLKRAMLPHPQFEVLELVDINVSVVRTFPKLQQQFAGQQLVFLFGSDVVATLPTWPLAERLLETSELIIGVRKHTSAKKLQQKIEGWYQQPKALHVIASYAPHISSGKVRQALYSRRPVAGLLRSVERYSDRHWLYVSLAGN
jgi:nicotinate-nucleotide adenylyltransferase